MAKHIRFEDTDLLANSKPMYWIVDGGDGNRLGEVFWRPAWRCWAVQFWERITLSQDCIAELGAFLRKRAEAKGEEAEVKRLTAALERAEQALASKKED